MLAMFHAAICHVRHRKPFQHFMAMKVILGPTPPTKADNPPAVADEAQRRRGLSRQNRTSDSQIKAFAAGRLQRVNDQQGNLPVPRFATGVCRGVEALQTRLSLRRPEGQKESLRFSKHLDSPEGRRSASARKLIVVSFCSSPPRAKRSCKG